MHFCIDHIYIRCVGPFQGYVIAEKFADHCFIVSKIEELCKVREENSEIGTSFSNTRVDKHIQDVD